MKPRLRQKYEDATYFRVSKNGNEIFNTSSPEDIIDFLTKPKDSKNSEYRIEAIKEIDGYNSDVIARFTTNQFMHTHNHKE